MIKKVKIFKLNECKITIKNKYCYIVLISPSDSWQWSDAVHYEWHRTDFESFPVDKTTNVVVAVPAVAAVLVAVAADFPAAAAVAADVAAAAAAHAYAPDKSTVPISRQSLCEIPKKIATESKKKKKHLFNTLV